MSNALDLTNMRQGHLVAIRMSPEHTDSHGKKWLCKCDCGNEVYVRASNFKSGHTRSCGPNCVCNLRSRAKNSKNSPMKEMSSGMVILPPMDREKVNRVVDYIIQHSSVTIEEVKKKFKLNSEEYEMIADLMMPALRYYNEVQRINKNIIRLRESFKIEGSVKNDASRIVAMSK